MVAAVDDLNAREGYRGTSFESVFLLSASEAGLNKINKMLSQNNYRLVFKI